MVKLERETPSFGGWDSGEFEIVAEFESKAIAEQWLEDNGYIKHKTYWYGTYWQPNIKWSWDKYRILEK